MWWSAQSFSTYKRNFWNVCWPNVPSLFCIMLSLSLFRRHSISLSACFAACKVCAGICSGLSISIAQWFWFNMSLRFLKRIDIVLLKTVWNTVEREQTNIFISSSAVDKRKRFERFPNAHATPMGIIYLPGTLDLCHLSSFLWWIKRIHSIVRESPRTSNLYEIVFDRGSIAEIWREKQHYYTHFPIHILLEEINLDYKQTQSLFMPLLVKSFACRFL